MATQAHRLATAGVQHTALPAQPSPAQPNSDLLNGHHSSPLRLSQPAPPCDKCRVVDQAHITCGALSLERRKSKQTPKPPGLAVFGPWFCLKLVGPGGGEPAPPSEAGAVWPNPAQEQLFPCSALAREKRRGQSRTCALVASGLSDYSSLIFFKRAERERGGKRSSVCLVVKCDAPPLVLLGEKAPLSTVIASWVPAASRGSVSSPAACYRCA